MFQEGPDFVAGKRTGEPLHVVLHEYLHGGTADRARAPNRHVHATGNRHVRANEDWMNRRFGEWANRRRPRFAASPFRRFVSFHYWVFKTAGRQSGFFRLPVPAYSKSLYTGGKQHAGSLHVEPQTEIELIIEKMDIAMTQHAKEGAVCVEIVGMNGSLIDLEVCTRFVRDAVSAAGKNPVQNSGERPKNRDGEDIAVGDFHLSTAAHGA